MSLDRFELFTISPRVHFFELSICKFSGTEKGNLVKIWAFSLLNIYNGPRLFLDEEEHQDPTAHPMRFTIEILALRMTINYTWQPE